MMALVLRVEAEAGARSEHQDPRPGHVRSQEHVFVRSPVRVGRSRLNDVRLDAPQVEAAHGIFHFGVEEVRYTDLQGGSVVNGTVLRQNEEVRLAAGAEVWIGALRVSQELCELRPVAEMVREAADTEGSTLQTTVDPPAVPAREAEALRMLRSFAEKHARCEAAPDSPEAIEALLGRAGEALKVLCRSFVELRRGQEEFGKELGLRVPQGDDGVHRAREGEELLAYLLDGSEEGRLAELRRAFGELMVHELALVEGVTAGGRALLEQFSPGAVKAVAGGAGPLAAWRCWKELEKRHEELACEERGVNEVLFGKEFARAYAAAALRFGGASEAAQQAAVEGAEVAEPAAGVDRSSASEHRGEDLAVSKDGEVAASTRPPLAIAASDRTNEREELQSRCELEDEGDGTGSFSIVVEVPT